MASRNRKKMSGLIFKRLFDHADSLGETLANSEKDRWLKKHSDDDANLMAKGDVKASRKVTRQIRAVHFEDEAKRYFAFVGLPPVEELPEGLTEIVLTPGIFAVAVLDMDIAPKATSSEIRDIVEGDFGGIEGYAGHDLAAVAALFPKLFVVEAEKNYTYTCNIDRVLGAMVAASYFDGPIALSGSTLKEIGELFARGSEYIPYPNILQGVLSISWGGLFVELYRCIEQLYAVPRLVELTKHWKTDKPFGEIAELLEKGLAWRPKEDESLFRVIDRCDESTVSRLIDAFEIVLSEKSQPPELAARAVYAMRNGLVHFRNGTKVSPPGDDKWDRIVSAMLIAVSDSYEVFGKMFHEYVGPVEEEKRPADEVVSALAIPSAENLRASF